MLHYFWLETESLEMLSRPNFLTMYTEQIQAPSLSVLPVPRWYGRQGYKHGISLLLHYSAHLPSNHFFLLELPRLAKMPTTQPGHLHPHCSTGCAVFHEHDLAVVSSFAEILGSHGLGCHLFPRRGPCPVFHMADVHQL